MYELMVLNPHGGGRRDHKGRFVKRARARRATHGPAGKARRRKSGRHLKKTHVAGVQGMALPHRNAKGRFVKRARAHRKSRKHHKRRAENPRSSAKRRASSMGYTVGTRKIRRLKLNPHRRHRRRNPMALGGIVGQITSAGLGAVGGVVLDVGLGYINPNLPATLTSGYGLHATRVGGALILGWGARKFLGARGAAMAHGMMTVALYGVIKTVLFNMLPAGTIPGLSGVDEIVVDTGNLRAGGGAGAYLTRMSGYLPGGERARGAGAYMRGYGGRVGAPIAGVDAPIMTGSDY